MKYKLIILFFICFSVAFLYPLRNLSQLKEEKLTTGIVEPNIELVAVNIPARVSCYIDTGTMASGKQTYKGAVATSDRSIPMGTKIYLEGFGIMTVEDKTALWVHTKFELPTIDVWMTEEECKEFGLKKLNYVIVE